jgi:hypothetical protein
VLDPGESLGARLECAKLAPDLIATEPDGRMAEGIEWTHRSASEAEIYFVSNQRDSSREVRLRLRMPGRGERPELWDAMKGEITGAIQFDEHDGRTELPIWLDPHGSLFVVFRRHDAAVTSPSSSVKWSDATPRATLDGPWSVTFSPLLGGPRELVVFPSLTDWTKHSEPGIRFYSGTASYRREFSWAASAPHQRVWLDLGDVANLAHVVVNGHDCGVAWTKPFRVEITSALRVGPNQLEISVTNTWANRLLGDRGTPSPITWTTAPARENATLLPAGLFGPVRLLTTQ